MSITFGALLYFQIIYLENMVKMREAQFSEIVMKCLSSTSSFLEKKETLHFLQEDINMLESNLFLTDSPLFNDESNEKNNLLKKDSQDIFSKNHSQTPSIGAAGINNVETTYKSMQEIIRSQYLYQRGLLNEVILSILLDSGHRDVFERADSTVIRDYLSNELKANGLNLPFTFSVSNNRDIILYATPGYDRTFDKGIYSQPLFPNTDNNLRLNVEFPSKNSYIFSSVRFIIPTLALTLILLVIFLFTIIMAFRQKKLTEMKTDFINNMTHELKTPISTISLAAQMLNDDSVPKSPGSLKHLSTIIGDESKRLQFQVEKVLQMSVLEKSATSLKFSEVNANNVIENVVNTFKIKAEKFGGSISCQLDAENSFVSVDPMHFTNIIYNLLDNAIKYMKEDSAPILNITTIDRNNSLEIRISDNGIGIKKEDLKKIFDKFYRVSTGNRHDVKGFGLGLAYVKKMISFFHGTIVAESEPGKGSTFILTLPLVYTER